MRQYIKLPADAQFWKIVFVLPIERTESDLLEAVIIFANGFRIYLSQGKARQKYQEKLQYENEWRNAYPYKPNGNYEI